MTDLSQPFAADRRHMRPSKSRCSRLFASLPVLLVAANLGCGKETEVEGGAVLLELSVAGGVSAPDELRVSVYDDAGTLWRDARVPGTGALVPESATRLGTVLIQPGTTQGGLRVHVRGFAASARVADGTLAILGARPVRAAARRRRFPPTRTATTSRTRSTTAWPSRTPARAAARAMSTAAATMAARTAATVDSGGGDDGGGDDGGGTDAFNCEVGRVQPGDRRGVHGRHAVHLQLLRRRRLLHERLHRPVPIVQPAEPRRDVPALRAGERSRRSNAPAGATCNGAGACGPPMGGPKPNGQLCGAGTECSSGFCKDGVCCNNACDTPCRTCETGTCVDVRRKPDPPECYGAVSCNPTGKCQ